MRLGLDRIQAVEDIDKSEKPYLTKLASRFRVKTVKKRVSKISGFLKDFK